MLMRWSHPVLALSLAAAILLVPSLALAEETGDAEASEGNGLLEEIEAVIDLSVYSKYMWRGVNVVDDPVLQPSLDLSAYGFGVNVWGNVDLTDVNGDQWEFSEVDLTFSYTFSLDLVELGAGAVVYYFPTVGGNTTELFVSAGIDTVLSPALTVYQDIDEVDGTYAVLSISHGFNDPFKVGEAAGISPELTASIGYGSKKHNEAYYGENSAGVADLTFGLVVPWTIADGITVAASAYYCFLIDSGIRDAADDADNFWAGVSLTLSF
jgi:hypothetical protein